MNNNVNGLFRITCVRFFFLRKIAFVYIQIYIYVYTTGADLCDLEMRFHLIFRHPLT